ncbi:hypothetical protein L7F22_053492 [Adiantum nelumboides]|nr:hypothetical protein [Adiantum nelumboides]
MLLDSAVQPDHVLGDHPKLIPTQLLAAKTFYLRVLHATLDAPFKDPEALPFTSEPVDGITMSEALAGPDASLWRQAMDSEYQSLLDNCTWELVPAPPQRKLVTCKWLLCKKLQSDALAAQFRFLIHQMDVRTAFLHGELEEEIYMKQPPGYVSTEHLNYVCKILKSLYGLKQSPHQWYRHFHQCMLDLGYIRFTSEPNIYTRHTRGVFFLPAIYVDDILLLSNSEPALLTAKEDLQSVFSMTDMGSLHFCLGIQVFQDPSKGSIHICQESYTQSLLKKFSMETCKGIDTPLPANVKIKQADSLATTATSSSPFPYANILGGIRYLVTCTRPDISFAANVLSRFLSSPGAMHIQYLKRVMRCLQQTKKLGLTYLSVTPQPSPSLNGYSDANWGGDQDTLHSTSGYTYLLFGAALAWQSKKQDRVTLSSTEAEYMTMTLSLKEGISLKNLLMETILFKDEPLLLHCDNMSDITLAKNLKHFRKTKHIAMKLHSIRELIAKGSLQLAHVRTELQWPDFLTKSLPKAKHLMSCQQLGLNSLK